MDDALAINLRILSPSAGLEGGLRLSDLPASTTVGELRRQIQHALPSTPAPERMRLIYRGKVVANDADTLETVFGTANIRESKDQSLHLVLRELPQAPAPAPASAPASAPSPSPAPAPAPVSPPLQTNPFRSLPQPRPDAQPSPTPHHHHHHPHHPHHPHVHHHHHVQQPLSPLNPLRTLPLPPQIQQQIAQALGQPTTATGTPTPQTQTPAPPHPSTTPPAASTAPHPSTVPPGPRTVHQQGIGPNGARWSVTYNDFTANVPLRPGQPTLPRPVPHPAFAIPPRPFGSPAPPGVSVPLTWLLPRLRVTLQEAAREVDNVRTLLTPIAGEDTTASPPAAWPSWRVERIREHLRTITHNLNMVESGLSDPAMLLNMDVIALRQAAGEVRRQANEFSMRLDAQEARASSTLAHATTPTTSAAAAADPLIATASAAAASLPSNAPPELFLLSSPQGPVGVLFDQRGTYTTAPFTTSSSQNFVNQFNQNRQLIANLGLQIAQGSRNIHTQLGSTQPPQPVQAQPAPAPDNALDHAAAQRVIDRIMRGPNQNQAAPANPDPDENNRVVNVAGHLWLIFKLACFVYIFAGGGGWYRPLMLGSIALVVYIIQLGIFEAQFAQIRHHFEALLPNAERLAQGRAAPPQPERRATTPEDAARRLLQQRRNGQTSWLREQMRTAERGVALFVASLWPGIGERMVHAQEERERLERVAASEAREEAERLASEAAEKAAEKAAAEAGADAGADAGTEADAGVSARDSKASQDASTRDEVPKPKFERMQTESLAADFMDSSSAASEQTQTQASVDASSKGKERAVDGDA